MKPETAAHLEGDDTARRLELERVPFSLRYLACDAEAEDVHDTLHVSQANCVVRRPKECSGPSEVAISLQVPVDEIDGVQALASFQALNSYSDAGSQGEYLNTPTTVQSLC